jgi:hypothetical protein
MGYGFLTDIYHIIPDGIQREYIPYTVIPDGIKRAFVKKVFSRNVKPFDENRIQGFSVLASLDLDC